MSIYVCERPEITNLHSISHSPLSKVLTACLRVTFKLPFWNFIQLPSPFLTSRFAADRHKRSVGSREGEINRERRRNERKREMGGRGEGQAEREGKKVRGSE